MVSTPLALVLLLSAQTGAAADPSDALREAPATETAVAAPVDTPPPAPATTTSEAADLATLQTLEAHLSVGHELSDAEVATLLALTKSPAPRARAIAAAVLPWLEPAVVLGPLQQLARDDDARVRATAAQSLVAVARRLTTEDRAVVVAAALGLLDDTDDEVACGGAELLAALKPPGMIDAFEARAAAASDLRHSCFVRFGGLAARPVTLPPAPKAPVDPTSSVTEPAPTPLPARPRDTGWIFVASAAGAGLLIGGALPAALVPARDVLVYDDDFSRLSRQDISFATQAAAAVATAAALGGGAWALDGHFALSPAAQTAVFGGVGSATVLGAGLGFMLDLKGGGPAWGLAGGAAAGLVGATALGTLTSISDDDNANALAVASLAGLAGGLGTFAVLPVALTEVGGVGRTDFGFGAIFAAAGVGGLGALALAPVIEVPAARAAAVAAGGLLGAGLLGGVAFAVVPGDIEIGSRVAAGAGLAGQVVGMAVGGLLIPDAWLGLDEAAVTDAEVAPNTADGE